MKWFAFLFILFILVTILLADLGAIPTPVKMLYRFPNGDRVGHFALYGILTFLVVAAFPRKVRLARSVFFQGSVVIAVLAAVEEFSQIFFPYRTADLIDLTFSLLGILCGDRLFYLLRRRPPS